MAPESPPAASANSVPGNAPVADGPPQKSCGDAEGGAAGFGGVEPASLWHMSPALSILAILDPPTLDGQPGRASFAPGLTQAERREIMFDDEWFAVRIRRREKLEQKQKTELP